LYDEGVLKTNINVGDPRLQLDPQLVDLPDMPAVYRRIGHKIMERSSLVGDLPLVLTNHLILEGIVTKV
jgi:hypothetical protein